ncbi:hypothetical protein MMC30_004081 [Trapelia coarctata]|nr:hypothetical protein [Trapelia coarctata]
MSESIKNVLIIGAGGNLGPSILSALDADSHFTVSVLSRQSSKSTFPAHIKVHTVADDYPENELLGAFKGIDAIVATTAMNAPQKSFIAAAAKAGVKRYLPAEFGGYSRDPRTLEFLPMFQWKNDIVDYLKTQEGTGLSWTGVCTGPFLDWGITNGFLGFNVAARKAVIYGGGDSHFTATTLSGISAAVVGVLRKPEETANKYVFVSSRRTTGNEILAALEKVSGEKWEVEHRGIEETTKIGREKVGKGDFSGMMELIVALVYGGSGSDYTKDQELANGLLGLPEESLTDIVARVVKE